MYYPDPFLFHWLAPGTKPKPGDYGYLLNAGKLKLFIFSRKFQEYFNIYPLIGCFYIALTKDKLFYHLEPFRLYSTRVNYTNTKPRQPGSGVRISSLTTGVSVLLIFSCLVLTSCGPDPESCFGFSQQGRETNQPLLVNIPVQFSNCSLEGKSFYWDFGDGSFSTDKNPVHKYDNPGMYTIVLNVKSSGKKNSYSRTLNIQNPSTADFIVNTWVMTDLFSVNYIHSLPVDTLAIAYSETIWKINYGGTIQISGFPETSEVKWEVSGESLITDSLTYQILQAGPERLHLQYTDTILSLIPDSVHLKKTELFFSRY